MKIIKSGKNLDKLQICKWCKCEFLYSPKDLETIYEEDDEYGVYVICPGCGNYIRLDTIFSED